MLTKEQALAQYGDVVCKFAHYYQYAFTFIGTAEDGAEVTLSCGSDAIDIYRLRILPDSTAKWSDSDDSFSRIWIRRDGETIYEKSPF